MKKLFFVLVVLFSLYNLYAQEFYYGAYLDKGDSTNELLYSYVGDSLKMNTVIQYANGESETQRNMLSGFNLIAVKADSPEDAVLHYSHGYYTKWEAEDVVLNTLSTGVKANFGSSSNYLNTNCWTSGIDSQHFGGTLLYGPHYRQDKKYRLWHMLGQPLEYELRFRTAGVYLDPQSNPTGDSVCTISVVFTYKIDTLFYNVTLKSITLFDTWFTDTFKDTSITYNYPSQFAQYNSKLSSLNEKNLLSYDDTYPATGIQFRVTWYGKMRLYIDKFEVYDQIVGKVFIDRYEDVVSDVGDFVNKYNGWTNIKYFYSLGEPQTIDLYTPARIVDSILAGLNAPRGLAEFYPQWEGQRNGDRTTKKFVEMANPSKVMMEFINYFLEGHTLEWEYEQQRGFLQELHQYRPDFWYEPLIAAPIKQDSTPCWLREPTSAELNASLMLGLAHGTKGIIFWKMVSSGAKEFNCGDVDVIYRCLLNSEGNSFSANPLFHYLKNDFSPRITGKLGSTLLGLDYTGHYAYLKRITPTQQCVNQSTEYLTLLDTDPSSDNDMNFHAGLLISKNNPENKYFLLANLFTTSGRSCRLSIQSPFTSYTNIRFRNIEGGLDTTFVSSITLPQTLGAGDGKLFQVAPVVKYGGKLIEDETISTPITLHDDMTIENGATLYVNSTYSANANITVKNGGKIIGGNEGQIVFTNGKQLIIEGDVHINGTANNRLKLFYEPTTEVGIKVRQSASLDISYCDIMESVVGISTEPNFQSITIENVNIVDCLGSGIGLIGPISRHSEATPMIKNCKIMHCGIGVSAANISELVIMQDSITNCYIGISLSQVPAAYIIGNNITSAELNFAGIFMHSSNGNIRGNFIQGNTNGIHLGSSSPDIGANTIINNSEHGIYIGSGSVPNLVAYYAGENPYPYTISGYNTIMENGNNSYGTMGGDGSEIYLNYSNILLDRGCNIIADDRATTPELPTILLMNGILQDEQPIYAYGNYWGAVGASDERFGNLTVYFDPPNIHPCPLPNTPCNELQVETSRGEIIDHIIPHNCDTEPISALAQSYAEANYLYSTGEVADARQVYHQITQGQYTPEEKLYAYNKLYTIGNLIDTTNNYFLNLQTTFTNLAQTVTDSTLMDVFTQNAILCKVSKGEYVSAINDFDNIIQQNPQSEEAVFAEMDILTTALLMDTTGGQLGKVAGGKYFIKGSADYLSKMSEVIKKNFGKAGKAKEKIIPTEYSLSQNYPNPFNPTTKIKYQLPYAAQVSLRIYDILGREITTLVNEEKQSGYYEVNFDAQTLSSGCYFYRIITKDFVKTMKMMVVK